MLRSVPLERLRGLQQGLASAEAAARAARYGPNLILEIAEHGWMLLARETLKDPMLWFLVGTSALFALVGVWPKAPSVPLPPEGSPATNWPVLGLLGLGVLVLLGWLVARPRLAPTRPVSATEDLAGATAALLALGVVALLVVATNPFALIFVLPSLSSNGKSKTE